MVWLIDDAAEAALGPWGLALGAGVAAVVLARKRLAPLAETTVGGETLGERARLAGETVGDRAREAGDWAKSALAEVAVVALPVTDRAQTAVAEVTEWWNDLYAEARSEWEAGRQGEGTSAVKNSGPPASEIKPGPRRRGEGGRFVKQTEEVGGN
jgi:hypothetical protein